ncbi:MAG TPA: hypothetical protein VMW58_09535 [Anaerolineae bacterium]|nr:hypothetical protein [Anaerolineae bacterium]
MNKRQTIKIATLYGMTSVRARIIAPGLAVHETNLGDAIFPNYVWGITHIPSGTHITHASTQPRAVKIARALAALTDWSKIEKDKVPNKLKRKVLETIASLV